MRQEFIEELAASGYIHRPLPLHTENSLEEERKRLPVLEKKVLWPEETKQELRHSGEGRLVYSENGPETFFALEGTPITYCWPEAMSPDGDCAFYGSIHAAFHFDRENWEGFHRLRCMIRPECDGSRITNMTVGICSDGTIKVPDEYYREGSHVLELVNHEWNDCIWEFGSMARDAVTKLDFACRLNGKDTATGEKISYQIKTVCLERLTGADHDKGWECSDGKVSYATTGYYIRGEKRAVTNRKETKFKVLEADTGSCAFEGDVRKRIFQGIEYGILDFSEINREGDFVLEIGDYRTDRFGISEQIFDEAAWKALNFIFCERCGYPVPGKHGLCHMDVIAKHQNQIISFCGGWHDAGDMSQQMIHTAETAHALFSAAEAVRGTMRTEEDRLLYLRLLEEAEWGLEFVLRTRFDGGYRATSAGLARWTNGRIGDEDDVEVRGHNHAFENLLCSAVCSHAARVLETEDKELSFKCKETAREDFAYGLKRYRTVGKELPIMWEHTYSSSDSLYAAVIVLAAAGLYELTQEREYAAAVSEYGKYVLSCQEDGSGEGAVSGYFYRDASKKAMVHFSHQSREYLFAEAFEAAARISKGQEKESFLQALRLYGSYLKAMMRYASPYEMLPAGVFAMSEAEDEETFRLLHLLVDYEEQKEHYRKQLRQGIHIGKDLYVKQFPVWFSFRGNSAIHLAMGRAAAIIGRIFEDEEYLQMAREQLYWINGKNPFGQSLIYGEGRHYARQYAVMPGEMTGEMPVGIETNEDEDIPYWPHTNNATYKEVWTSTAVRWMWIWAELRRISD